MLVYLGIAIVIFYVGPYETIVVKKNLKKDPVNVIVSLTTTPYRIDQIKPVLDSILRQSIKPKVYVNIPYQFKRDNTKYVIPNWLKNYPNIIINRTKDYGPATKLLGTLKKEHDPNTIIITIDDDKVYAKHMVRDFVGQYLFDNKKNEAITTIGVNFLFNPNFDFYTTTIIENNTPSLTVLGIGGVAYRRSFFKDDIFELINNLPLSCFLSDDLIIAAYLYVNNINIVTTSGISYNSNTIKLLLQSLPSSVAKDALSMGANGVSFGSNEANYSNCLLLLPYYNKIKYQQVMLDKSKEIHSLLQQNSFRIAVKKLCYSYLDYLINIIPFAKKIIVMVVG